MLRPERACSDSHRKASSKPLFSGVPVGPVGDSPGIKTSEMGNEHQAGS